MLWTLLSTDEIVTFAFLKTFIAIIIWKNINFYRWVMKE